MYLKQNSLKTTVIACLALALVVSMAAAQGPSDLNSQLAQARAATAMYHDFDTAVADGYVPAVQPISCHGNENGAVGISYVNVSRFLSPGVDELQPEFLNYIPTENGNLRLVSVAYGNRVLYRDTRPPETPGFRPGIFPWQQPVIPPFLEEVSGAFSVYGQPANGPLFFGRWIYLITAHIWAPNPDGMFADLNPRLRCPD